MVGQFDQRMSQPVLPAGYGYVSPEYRTRFAADLKKMLPRIPQVPGSDRFRAFATAGRELSALHIGYESLEPHPLNEVATGLAVQQDDYARYAVTKMKYAGKAGAWDKTRIIYNAHISLHVVLITLPIGELDSPQTRYFPRLLCLNEAHFIDEFHRRTRCLGLGLDKGRNEVSECLAER
ncbi:type ISP restriction/modification enzyme [Arthrobacter sp. 754]|uniref:type ISP restriction/modification enzyme n=1 Tax=Arthrobacter sp. 754 TaxID=3156315 RepID=UPI003393745E